MLADLMGLDLDHHVIRETLVRQRHIRCAGKVFESRRVGFAGHRPENCPPRAV